MTPLHLVRHGHASAKFRCGSLMQPLVALVTVLFYWRTHGECPGFNDYPVNGGILRTGRTCIFILLEITIRNRFYLGVVLGIPSGIDILGV